jgi:hypothetical protein
MATHFLPKQQDAVTRAVQAARKERFQEIKNGQTVELVKASGLPTGGHYRVIEGTTFMGVDGKNHTGDYITLAIPGHGLQAIHCDDVKIIG